MILISWFLFPLITFASVWPPLHQMEPHDEKGDSEVQFAKKSLEMKSLLSKTILSKNQMEPHDEKGESEVQLEKTKLKWITQMRTTLKSNF